MRVCVYWYARLRARIEEVGTPETEDQIIIIIITICVAESLKVGSFARSKEPTLHSLERIEKACLMSQANRFSHKRAVHVTKVLLGMCV